jgi:dTDP-4-dehydrorhamnose 3,5-epimerase
VRFIETDLAGVLVIEPDVHRDARGFFVETYHLDKYRNGGVEPSFVQDNLSQSVKHTLRGLHLQVRRPQGKLIRVIQGEIYDVSVDVRPDSPAFGRWFGVMLSADNFRQCYVPPGFAHGFCVMSDVAQVAYKCTELYSPADEIGILWNDPALGIKWPFDDPILSDRDRRHPTLEGAMDSLKLTAATAD